MPKSVSRTPTGHDQGPPGIISLTASDGAFERATGTKDADLQTDLLMQLSNTLWLPKLSISIS